MVCHPLPAATSAAAMSVALLECMFMLVVAPVEANYCDGSAVLPAGATFSSPALVVDLEVFLGSISKLGDQVCKSTARGEPVLPPTTFFIWFKLRLKPLQRRAGATHPPCCAKLLRLDRPP